MVSKRRILVVDDEPGIRQLLTDLLSAPGYEVVTAGNGHEAVERLQDSPFDAIVTDLNMPGMDGIGLLRWMKQNGRKEKVVVMTGSPMHNPLPRRGIPEVRAALRKPFRVQSFIKTMEALFTDNCGESGREKPKTRKATA